MKCLTAVFLLLAVAYGSIEEDRGVLVLTNDNFEEAVETHEHVLVEFYAPWCGHCKALEPEYIKAAERLRESNSGIQLAKVDATEQTELATQFGVNRYPTLKFFRSGKPMDFRGSRTADGIVSWLQKKTSDPAKKIATAAEAKEFADGADVVVLGLFRNLESDAAKQYLSAAQENDDFQFGISAEDEVYEAYGITDDSVVLLKKFDEGKAVLSGDLSPESIARFVATESMPLVVEMNRSTSQKIFRGALQTHLLFFVQNSAENTEHIISTARSAAQSFKGKVQFISVDTEDGDNQRLEDFFGVKESEVPTMRLLNIGADTLKYKADDDFSESYIKEFVQDFFDGKLKPHYLSQELPEDWDKNPVKVLVASNFDSVALDESKDVLVEFYAPWCGHCKKLEPIYDELASKYEDNASVVIAKIDGTLNELEHTKIQGFPTIKLFRKGDNKVVDFTGPRTLDGLVQFLDEQLRNKPQETEEDVKTKDEL